MGLLVDLLAFVDGLAEVLGLPALAALRFLNVEHLIAGSARLAVEVGSGVWALLGPLLTACLSNLLPYLLFRFRCQHPVVRGIDVAVVWDCNAVMGLLLVKLVLWAFCEK